MQQRNSTCFTVLSVDLKLTPELPARARDVLQASLQAEEVIALNSMSSKESRLNIKRYSVSINRFSQTWASGGQSEDLTYSAVQGKFCREGGAGRNPRESRGRLSHAVVGGLKFLDLPHGGGMDGLLGQLTCFFETDPNTQHCREGVPEER